MAIVLVEVNRKAQRGCNCNNRQQQTDTAAAQRVMQTAAAMPAATPDPGTAEAAKEEWSLNYATWLALLSFAGGLILMAQTKK